MPPRHLATIFAAAAAALLLLASVARATEAAPEPAGTFTLKVEPGLAIPLTDPQSALFKVGGSANPEGALEHQSVHGRRAERELHGAACRSVARCRRNRLDVRRQPSPETAAATSADDDRFHGLSPWPDADALYVRTGELDRPGFDAAVGLAVPVGESRIVLDRAVRALPPDPPDQARTGFDDARRRSS